MKYLTLNFFTNRRGNPCGYPFQAGRGKPYPYDNHHHRTINKTFLFITLLLFTITLNANEAAISDTLQTNTPRERRYELDEIRVIATTPAESAGIIDIIRLEDTSRASELNLSDILRNISGVTMTVGSRGESNLRIRGFRSENINLMVDGRRINAGYFGSVNLAEMPLFDIEEIHVVKGAVSNLYGTNSSGGVINFVTKRPANDSWLTVRTSIKRNNTQSLQLISGHSFNVWDYWLNLSGFKTDGFFLSRDFVPTYSENGGVRDFSNNKSFDIQSKVNFTLFDIHSIGFSSGYSFLNERNVPGNIYEARFRQFKDVQRWHLSSLGSFQLSPNLIAQPNVYYDAYGNTYQEFRNQSLSPESMTLDSRLDSWTFGLKNRLELVLSPNSKLSHLFFYEKEAYNRKDNQGYLEWTSNSTNLYNTGLFFNQRINSAWETSVSTGLSNSIRYYREDYADDRNTLETGWQLEPALSLHYHNNRNALNIAISRNIQYPYLQQLYSNSRGNLKLLPEKVLKSEINYHRWFSIANSIIKPEISLYHNYITDMIDRAGVPRFINQRELMNAGLELSVGTYLYINRFCFIETSHSLNYIDLNMNKNYVFYQIPEYSFYNALQINLIENISLNYDLNWEDKILSPDSDGRLFSLPAKTVHNAGIHYTYNNYKIAFTVSNIFDKDYEEEWGYPAPGRNFSLSLEWKI